MTSEYPDHESQPDAKPPSPEQVVFSESTLNIQLLCEASRFQISMRTAPDGQGTFFLDGVQVSGYKRDGLVNIKPTADEYSAMQDARSRPRRRGL